MRVIPVSWERLFLINVRMPNQYIIEKKSEKAVQLLLAYLIS